MNQAKMAINVFIVIVALMITCGVCFSEENKASGFVPQWEVGDQWYLEAAYKDLKTPGEPWLPPVLWVFHVRAKKQIHRQEAYVVHVYPKNQEFMKIQAILYLSTHDLRPLRIIDIFPSSEGVKSKEREVDPFNPAPVLSQDSLIPYDFPVFPLVKKTVQMSDSLDAYREPKATKFSKVTNAGGLKFKKSISQLDKAPDKQYADIFSAYKARGEMFQVEFFDSGNHETLVQIWQEGSPWALSTVSSVRKIRLVPEPREGQGGGK